MKITNLTSQITKLIKKEDQEPKRVSAPVGEKGKNDSLELSPGAKEAKTLVLKALAPTQDSEKVEDIKRQIERGEYKVDSKELAKRMLSDD